MIRADPRIRLRLVEHVRAIGEAVPNLASCLPKLERWGIDLAAVLEAGGRLLVAGNGGSAAHAQHLTSELVGRYVEDRQPYSAIALHTDTSSATAIVNDYGADELFCRQVRAHGRRGDVFLAISTSGASANLTTAADAAIASGLACWAITGPTPNPLVARVDDWIACDAQSTAVVQELHQIIVHLLCETTEHALQGDVR